MSGKFLLMAFKEVKYFLKSLLTARSFCSTPKLFFFSFFRLLFLFALLYSLVFFLLYIAIVGEYLHIFI